METLLTIAQDPNQDTLKQLSHHYHVLNVNSVETASQLIAQTACDSIFADIDFLSSPLIDFIHKVRRYYPFLPIICRHEQQHSPLASELSQISFTYLILKDDTEQDLRELLEHAHKQLLLQQLAFDLHTQATDNHPLSLVGESLILRNLRNNVIQLAAKEEPILILGEEGSGKQHLARYIHSLSSKSDNFLVTVKASELEMPNSYEKIFGSYDQKKQAIIPGKFDSAHSSTLHIQDFQTASKEIKEALVHFIREGYIYRKNSPIPTPSNALVLISGTAGRENDEAYSALKTLLRQNTVHTIPLRERKEDIPMLAYSFLQEKRGQHEAAKMNNIDSRALEDLRAFDWPLNLDQLRSVIDYCLLFNTQCQTLLPGMLPHFIYTDKREVYSDTSVLSGCPEGLEEEVNKLQKRLIVQALSEAGGRQVHAARLLKTTPRILNHRIKQLDIQTVAK
ncbi:MAG: sigma 54-interacting transcriptional regulator [Verrucomicrobiota bacterium]